MIGIYAYAMRDSAFCPLYDMFLFQSKKEGKIRKQYNKAPISKLVYRRIM